MPLNIEFVRKLGFILSRLFRHVEFKGCNYFFGGANVILTDREIKLALVSKLITIDPLPLDDAYSSTAIDLTLDPHITLFKDDDGSGAIEKAIDPNHKDFKPEKTLSEISEQVTISDDGFLLKRNRLILAWTAEYINLHTHNRVAARVEGKSSLARLGLGVHITAPTIHAGFDGHIRLEMYNHGQLPIRLRPGMKICQLIFEQTLGTPDKGYQGQFTGQGA